MLTTRTFRIVWINKSKPRGLNAGIQADETIRYKGDKITIEMQ